jgi:hypothetical protein
MKNGLTEIIILHDNNAPIPDFEEQVRKGSKAFWAALKKCDSEVRATLAAFGESCKMHTDDVPVSTVRTNVKHFIGGSGVRNIFDSLGCAIAQKGEAYSASDESEHPENVIFVLTSFGRDNASKNFTYRKVAKMIAHQSYVYKWRFFCLTNEAVLIEQLGIPEENIIRLDFEQEEFFPKALDELSEKILNIISRSF